VAVVQISRIQIRRGQKNQGTGLPQLASGELGWAIDTKELFIGNGSVSEGAAEVGNTKILTQYDNIFTLSDSYTYRSEDGFIQTGSSGSPIQRSLQDRLDDRVSVRSFGVTGESSQDATAGLQRAINQLFLNDGITGEQGRVILHLEPGVYNITSTIEIPPQATIVGAGPEKTVIKQSTANAIFKTVNSDNLTPTFNTQAHNIICRGMTLQTTQTGLGLLLDNCRDSLFENIDIIGPFTAGDTIPTDYSTDIGLKLDSLSGSVESGNNKFINIRINGFAYGVMSNWDINNNIFDKCEFSTLGNGIAFGVDMALGTPAAGTSVGPSNTTISNCNFKDINRYGIWIENGNYNLSSNNSFVGVGNEAGTEGQPQYSILKFAKTGNQSINDYFARTAALSYNQSYINNTPYIPEIEGVCNFENTFEHKVTISRGTNIKTFRLPALANQSFDIDYLMVSNNYEMIRSGNLHLTMDAYGTPTVSVTDAYDYAGNSTYESAISFAADILDEDGDLTNETISVKVTSTMPNDDETEMKFKIKNKKTDAI
tara:strand:+ start:1988 stop:3610 length:1623 start_codon:yes stop_codon:yes gene_type:complete